MRNFIQFSGFALDPRLQFTAFIFSSTALNDTVYLGWINYRFSDALDIRVGNWLVPGTREWNESFRFHPRRRIASWRRRSFSVPTSAPACRTEPR